MPSAVASKLSVTTLRLQVPSLVVLVRMLRPAMFVLLSTRPLRTFFSRGAVSFAAARMLEVATSATTGWGALESAAWHSSLSVVAVSGCLCDGAALAVGDSGLGARLRLCGC